MTKGVFDAIYHASLFVRGFSSVSTAFPMGLSEHTGSSDQLHGYSAISMAIRARKGLSDQWSVPFSLTLKTLS